jgi:hypothetical protein
MCVRSCRLRLLAAVLLSFSCHSDPPIGPSANGLRREPRPRPAGASTATPTALPTATATTAPTSTPTPGGTATVAPTARATATATATSTAAPTATPTPDDSGGPLQPGPVAAATLRLFSVRYGDTFREPPFDDGNGTQVTYLDEILIFDVTPRNAANKPCEAQGEPEWTIENNRPNGNANDYLMLMSSSNPFLLRVKAQRKSDGGNKVQVFAKIDGITTSRLFVTIK